MSNADLEVPAQMVVDALRNQVATLNDEVITLRIKLQHAYSVIESQQKAEENAAPAPNNLD